MEVGTDPLSTAFYRCAIAALALAAYGALRGDLRVLFHLPARVLFLALLSGVLMVGNWVLFFEAIRRSGIAVATIVFHVQPFVMVLIGALVFRERLCLPTLGWIALALFGLALATGIFDAPEGHGPDWIGVLCAVGAAIFYAVVTIIAKGFPRSNGAQLTLLQCLCGVLILAPWLPLPPQNLGAEQWAWLAMIGGVHTCAVYVLLYNALPKLPTATAAVLLFLYPISAIAVDAFWYRHAVTGLQIMGCLCVLLASLAITLKCGGPAGCRPEQVDRLRNRQAAAGGDSVPPIAKPMVAAERGSMASNG
ncbi:EamA family transporter [Fuscovulum blasticum DSM 2131]|uniref:EamA family transporter n=1 Tax=Fuscovulum blasticum DSM 2131 TaxID=1188250 RepID=A0A2T4J5P8_FUSBL|nr:EamA family transporter [Fuscovulum blasticum DSM 2131]